MRSVEGSGGEADATPADECFGVHGALKDPIGPFFKAHGAFAAGLVIRARFPGVVVLSGPDHRMKGHGQAIAADA